jgi:hypothetical protein
MASHTNMASHTRWLVAASLALLGGGVAAQVQKGGTPPPFDFVKVWNDGPQSFDQLLGKVVLLDFGATW